MGESGEDIKSPSARKEIPYSFECKNQESINIWKSLEQLKKILMVTLFDILKEIEVKYTQF